MAQIESNPRGSTRLPMWRVSSRFLVVRHIRRAVVVLRHETGPVALVVAGYHHSRSACAHSSLGPVRGVG